jgi:GMP synthase-like glutamine amidotransferase
LASSSSCENEIFCCGTNNNILACQSHPEFDKVFCIDERIWPAVVEKNKRLDEESQLKSIESMVIIIKYLVF